MSDAPAEIDRLLAVAKRERASDLHLEPSRAGYDALLRVDGLLLPHGTYPADLGRALVTRLMVLARLLTYRVDVPQEGRFSPPAVGGELRVSIMPTVKGLRAVVRFPAESTGLSTLDALGLSVRARQSVAAFLSAPAGMLIVTGPAGAGKTTLCYAILTAILGGSASRSGISIVTLEDPVERLLDGITQIEVTPFGQLTYERALRSMLRQDPQVLMLGEVRDRETAALAAQAALSGHRMLVTLHAADCAGALRRLLDMGVAPEALASSLVAILATRLVRRRVPETGAYHGRLPITESVVVTAKVRQSLVGSTEVEGLQQAFEADPAYTTLLASAKALVEAGLTDEAEIMRVLGEGTIQR